MNCIIDPWVFYLLNLLGNIEVLCWTLIITGLAVYVVYILVWLMADLYDSDKYPSPLAILKKWKIPVILCHYGINSDSVTRDLLQNAYRISGHYGTYRRRKGNDQRSR